MKFIILLGFLIMMLANPITGGKLFPGFNNPEKWMKRVIRKLQRKTSAYGNMIASNTADISKTAGFISSIAKCDYPKINDPDNGLSCCFEDNSNEGQCLCNGMTIDDTSNPGSCCIANQRHPDHCLCSGTDIDDPNNPGNCCFKDENNPNLCLCNGNYTDNPNKRCFNLDWKGDGVCDDQNNHAGCDFDGKDCCGEDPDTDLCTLCQCLEGEAPLPNAVGCCYPDPINTGQCLCTGIDIDDPDNGGSCCVKDPGSPGTCCIDSITCNGQGTCSSVNNGICVCDSGFTGDRCNVTTCPGVPVCSDSGNCPQGGTVCECQDGFHGDDCAIFCYATTTCNGQGTCDQDGICQWDPLASPFPRRYLLISAGNHGVKTEVLDILDPTRSCSEGLGDYPWITVDGAPTVMLNGTPVACGMKYDTANKDCYSFNGNSWTLFATTFYHHHSNSGILLKGNTPAEDKLWVFGTANSNPDITSDLTHEDIRKSTEYVFANGTVTLGPSMPYHAEDPWFGNVNHCMVGIIGGDIMIMQTHPNTRAPVVYRYNPSTNIYTRQENGFPGPGQGGACTSFYSAKHGNRHVIYYGGGYSTGCESTGNCAINAQLFDYTFTNEWEVLPPIPENTAPKPTALPTPTGDGIFHIFGKKIHELNCDSSSCSWTTRSEELALYRNYNFVAVYIPEELTNCSPPLGT